MEKEKNSTISRVAQRVVDAVKPAKSETATATEPATATALVNPVTPTPVEDKKGYNLFKNPQGKWELQLNRRSGNVSKTVYETEKDAKEVVEALGLDKKK